MSRRYPLQALLDATGLGEHALGVQVGLSGSSLKKARELGLVESAADKYACRAGLHPFEVWPDFGMAECSAESCQTLYAARHGQHRFCSARCRQREKMRRYRATQGGAANNRKWRMAWYADCRDYDMAVSRRRRDRTKNRDEKAA